MTSEGDLLTPTRAKRTPESRGTSPYQGPITPSNEIGGSRIFKESILPAPVPNEGRGRSSRGTGHQNTRYSRLTHRLCLDVHFQHPAPPFADAADPLSNIELERPVVDVTLDGTPEPILEFCPCHRWTNVMGARRGVGGEARYPRHMVSSVGSSGTAIGYGGWIPDSVLGGPREVDSTSRPIRCIA